MQCKDIPNAVFIDAIRLAPGTSVGNWRMRWDVHAALETLVGPVPDNLFMAKFRKLHASGKVGGCPCGCRGDLHVSAECTTGCCARREAA